MKFFCEDERSGQIITDYSACPKREDGACPEETADGLKWCLKDHKDITVTHFRPNGKVEQENDGGINRGVGK